MGVEDIVAAVRLALFIKRLNLISSESEKYSRAFLSWRQLLLTMRFEDALPTSDLFMFIGPPALRRYLAATEMAVGKAEVLL